MIQKANNYPLSAACPRLPRAASLPGPPFHNFNFGDAVPKPNYHHARKQKELARKARQLEKQQRRSTRPSAAGEETTATPTEAPAVAGDAVSENGA